VLFRRAISPSPWTLPSHVSLFTGLHPVEHRITEDNILKGKNIFAVKTSTSFKNFLPEILKEQGYRTVGFSNNPWISSNYGFDRGFDAFFENWGASHNRSLLRRLVRTVRRLTPQKFHPVINNLKARLRWLVISDSGAESTVLAMKKWFYEDYEHDRPFFAFFNFLEPHLPYTPPKPFHRLFMSKDFKAKRINQTNQDHLKYVAQKIEMDSEDFEILTSLYDGEIAYLDSQLKEIFQFLKNLNVFDRTLLIVTSDHGENIGEHGLMGHQFCLYDTLLRVPLIIRYPEVFSGGRIEELCVQSSDLYYTILDLLDIPLKDQEVHKRSFLNADYSTEVISEHEIPRIALSAIKSRFADFKTERLEQEIRCLYTDGFKYIWNQKRPDELYDLTHDPGEKTNILAQNQNRSSKLLQTLKKWQDSKQGAEEEKKEGEGEDFQETIDEEIRKKLKGLGYI
jgi:arylsulfatase A-like enzyme